MKRFLLYIIVATSLLPMGVAQNFVYYGDSCYCFNDPDSILLPDPYNTEDNFGIHYPIVHPYDYALQQYPESSSVYGIALMLEFLSFQYENVETGIRMGYTPGDEPDVRTAMEYVNVFALLYVKHEKGELEKVDSIRWHPDSAYRYFTFRQPEFNFYRTEPVYELYFENPHFLAEIDTAWIGVSISIKDTLTTVANTRFHIYTPRDLSNGSLWLGGYWGHHSGGEQWGYNRWGGVFPITCPKPEGPVEDTVDNGIRDVSYLNSNISIYPNPASDFITVNCDNMQKAVIYNSLGQQTLSFTTNKADISTLPNGIYFLKVFTPSNILTRKLVIQK